MIEFDVQLTKDGQLIVCHDENIKRITGKEGLIAQMTLKELKNLDFGEGEKIPTLRELVELTKNKIGLNCEIKVKGIAKPIIELLKGYDVIESTIISSFLHDELLNVQKINSTIKIASLEPTTVQTKKMDWKIKKEMIQYCIDNNLYAINPILMIVDQQFVDFAHQNNIKVFPWTVDHKIYIKKFIKFGVDGIITNDISKTKTLIKEYSKN
jgi:glycerophosphoryl diester phosphodiesterase